MTESQIQIIENLITENVDTERVIRDFIDERIEIISSIIHSDAKTMSKTSCPIDPQIYEDYQYLDNYAGTPEMIEKGLLVLLRDAINEIIGED